LPDDPFILSIILVPGPRIELQTLVGYTKCIQMTSEGPKWLYMYSNNL